MIRRHVGSGVALPLHPEAAAFADHYSFAIDVLAAYRPTGKGRVGRQVTTVCDHVLVGRSFVSIAQLDGIFASWLPIRRGQVHRTTAMSSPYRLMLIGPPWPRCRSSRICWRRSMCGGSQGEQMITQSGNPSQLGRAEKRRTRRATDATGGSRGFDLPSRRSVRSADPTEPIQ